MKKLLLLSILGLWLSAQGQEYIFEATIKNAPEKEFYLADFYGDKNHLRDTVKPDASGYFSFKLKESYYPGMYRVFLDKDVFFDFIYNHENIKIKTDYDHLADSLKVISSEGKQALLRISKGRE